MKNGTKFAQQKKRKAVGMLNELSKRIQNGELIVEECGFWPSRFDNRIIFRIVVISRDNEKESKNFEQFS